MNTLAVDTSAQTLVVAVRTDRVFAERTLACAMPSHSERIMDAIIGTCADAGITTKDIDLFACTRGPGSFTGLRIGMATLKGLAAGFAKPLVSVSTLEAHAANLPAMDKPVIVALDARKQRFYLAAFDNAANADGRLERLLEDTDGDVADLEGVLEGKTEAFVTGPDAGLFAERLREAYPAVRFAVYGSDFRDIARNIVDLAERQFAQKGADHIGQGPVYIRKSDAEQALEDREKAKAKENANG